MDLAQTFWVIFFGVIVIAGGAGIYNLTASRHNAKIKRVTKKRKTK